MALSTQQKTLASNFLLYQPRSVLFGCWNCSYLQALLCLPENVGIFVTLPKNNVQKGATAYIKEISKVRTYILLLSEIGWGAVFKELSQ